MRVIDKVSPKRPLAGKQLLVAALALFLGACSVNPATGEKQFTALMSPAAEARVGAEQHPQVLKESGGLVDNAPLQAYVNQVGQRVAAQTERGDVQYHFFVIDDPAVNAFAIPGGYIYVTRGLLALANTEAELAGVLAHEIGHITARHSAERYSQQTLAGVGLAVLSATVDQPGVARAAGFGAELGLKSYSRSQEYQSDELGVRYLARAGYNPRAIGDFLAHLDANDTLNRHIDGKQSKVPGYFSTHPNTSDRVARAHQLAAPFPPGGHEERDAYLRHVDRLTYGDSAAQGFLRGRDFIHPEIGFRFTFPPGFDIKNAPDKVQATSTDGAGIIFDAATNNGAGPLSYLQAWGGSQMQDGQAIPLGNIRAATGSFAGRVNGQPATIRLVAIDWDPKTMFRFQIAMPQGTEGAYEPQMQKMVNSFRPIGVDERNKINNLTIDLVTARAGDTAETLAKRMTPVDDRDDPLARFYVLNGLSRGEPLVPGRVYKVIR